MLLSDDIASYNESRRRRKKQNQENYFFIEVFIVREQDEVVAVFIPFYYQHLLVIFQFIAFDMIIHSLSMNLLGIEHSTNDDNFH